MVAQNCLRPARTVLARTVPTRTVRGYTIVELMMALAIFAIGITGVAAMQKVTSSANAHAKNLAVATRIAESWLDALTIDASAWTQNSASRATTNWLQTGMVASTPTWALPASTTWMGPGFDAQGTPTATASKIVYCTHVRLGAAVTTSGAELIRTEVRVFWAKEGGGFTGGTSLCAETIANVTGDDTRFHFVYKSSAVRQTAGSGAP